MVGHLTFGIWIEHKKNLWIFFQKYGFIRKIETFHLRMKHIIQMTSKMSKEPPLRLMASITMQCSTSFCFQKLKRMTWKTFGFNRTGATCHTANVTIDLLRTVFENRIISRNSDVNWPPRRSDLTPLYYFLWGAVKDKYYTNHPETIEALKPEIKNLSYSLLFKMK